MTVPAALQWFLYRTIPTPFFIFTAAEIFILAGGAVVVYSLLLLTDPHFSPPSPTGTLINVYGNRAGFLFIGMLPWVVLLSSKNSLIGALSGIGYERLQVYHRCFARMALSLAFIHAGIKLRASTSFTILFRRFGLGAFCIAGVIFFIGSRNSLNKGYQAYVNIHILLVAGLFAALWFHVRVPAQDTAARIHPYLYPAYAAWLADRLARLFQLIWVNALYAPCGSSVGAVPTRVTILSDSMLKLELYKPNLTNWAPGSHVFLCNPPGLGVSRWFEGHPFTIASLPPSHYAARRPEYTRPKTEGSPHAAENPFTSSSEMNGGRNGQATGEELEMERLRGATYPPPNGYDSQDHQGFKGSSYTSAGNSPVNGGFGPVYSTSNTNGNGHDTWREDESAGARLTFFIKRRGGFTKRLYDRALARRSLKLLVYGPFSPTTSFLGSYETLIIAAGGSGISWALPMLLDACRRERGTLAMARQVLFVWCVHTADQIHWIAEAASRALHSAPTDLNLDMRIYVTGELAHRRQPPRVWNELPTDGRHRAPWIFQGRPIWPDVLQKTVAGANGRVWVGVCGPQPLMLKVRKCTADLIRPGLVLTGEVKYDITLHTEVFGW